MCDRRKKTRNKEKKLISNFVSLSLLLASNFPIQDCDEIRNIFARFGQIESVNARRHSAHENPYYYVQFMDRSDAATALGSDLRHEFWLKVANTLDQPDHPLQTLPDQSNNIDVLDDHCWQEILMRLNVLDLKNMADVCKRFRNQVQHTFTVALKRLDRRFGHRHWRNLTVGALRLFGMNAKTLCVDIDGNQSEAKVIELISENCGPQLKRIELCAFSFDGQMDSLRPIEWGDL